MPRAGWAALFMAAGLLAFGTFQAQPRAQSQAQQNVQADNPPSTPEAPPSRSLDDLAEGPYDRLVIRDAMVFPGHGGPVNGPYDIVIEGNEIAEMVSVDPITLQRAGGDFDRPEGDRVIDAEGKYVMPGMIDLHMHLRHDPIPLEYVYYLKLAHGVTTMVPAPDRGLDNAMEEARRSERNEIVAPRMYPIWGWGSNTGYSREELENPDMAEEIAREMVDQGAHVVSVGGLAWKPELFEAVSHAVEDAGGITTVHLPPSTMSMTDAVDAARMGVTMIEHHYGYSESSLDRQVQNFPRDYEYNDESKRFREAGRVWTEANEERLLNEVADSLVEYGATLLPTRVVYEANRDILRAISLPWHDNYTHQELIDVSVPSEEWHGAYHWDWTNDDEYFWYKAFDLWGELIYEVNKRGGRVAYGTDDNYIWATPGFSNVRELQLIREAGLHNQEVLKTATYNSAQTLRRPDLGLVRPGYTADLVIVDGNPVKNNRFLYSFGAMTTDHDDPSTMHRTEGIVHTIKDGVVVENDRLMDEVARMVVESREGTDVDEQLAPFIEPHQ